MKSMRKGLAVSRVFSTIKRKAGGSAEVAPTANPQVTVPPPDQAPELTANQNVKAFCQSGGNVKGDEILYLPPIVESAESSPAAAAECARVINKFLSKEYNSRPSWQYNALMLLRILTDNPGQSFTQNIDENFVETVRKLLKHGRDNRTRQMLMETLDDFQHTKMDDENLKLLVELWKKEKVEAFKKHGAPPPPPQQPPQPRQGNPHSQNYFARNHHNKRLPDPTELASRLEEARTSAKLLEQVVMNTPPAEVLNNDLIKEFADRCLSASRSIQGYMVCDNPAPDNDTMETLIDTNEQLQTALNQHQRARLNARKQLGLGEGNEEQPATNGHTHDRVLQWQQSLPAFYPTDEESGAGPGKGKAAEVAGPSGAGPSAAGPSASGSGLHRDHGSEKGADHHVLEDPFRDPQPGDDREQRHAYEPFNPGFKPTVGDDTGKSAAGGLAPGGQAGQVGNTTRRTDDVSDDDDDIYDAEPRGKQPVYRY